MAELEIIGPDNHAGVRICRMLCVEKGIPYRHRKIDENSKAARKENQTGSLPALRHGKVRLFTTRGITSYIDNRFKGRSLIPSDVIRAAEVNQWIHFHECSLQHISSEPDAEKWKTCQRTNSSLAAANDCIGSTSWLVGRGFTLADLWFMPAVHTFRQEVGEQTMLKKYPALALWLAKHEKRKSWQTIHCPPDNA